MANNWKLGLGLLAGAAAGYWLNTSEGRRFRKRAQSQLNDYSENAGQYLAEQTDRAEEGFNRYVGKGKELIEQGKETAQEKRLELKNNLISGADTTADAAERTVDSLSDSLKKGISKAKKNVKSGAGKIA